jgi:hypothetical protein
MPPSDPESLPDERRAALLELSGRTVAGPGTVAAWTGGTGMTADVDAAGGFHAFRAAVTGGDV